MGLLSKLTYLYLEIEYIVTLLLYVYIVCVYYGITSLSGIFQQLSDGICSPRFQIFTFCRTPSPLTTSFHLLYSKLIPHGNGREETPLTILQSELQPVMVDTVVAGSPNLAITSFTRYKLLYSTVFL